MPRLDRYFAIACDRKASDLHFTSGMPPLLRLHGRMQQVEADHPPIAASELAAMLLEIAPEENRKEFEETSDTDFAYAFGDRARFRANLFRDRTGPGGVFRQIPREVVPAEKLGLPKAVLELCQLTKGLVVVTGPTGSGKSTTLAALVDYINRTRDDHILTIEDPIEFVHQNKRCLINQREVGPHTISFKRALRAALREDPNVVVVGEMRDLETIAIAIEMAETGHLVFGTLHTTTAASTIDRIIDQFPHEQQQQIRTMLADSLRGVVAQTLLRKKDGSGRIAALEVLIGTTSVAANIREGKTHQIPLAMQTGRKLGMFELNQSLVSHVASGEVDAGEAYLKAVDKASLLREYERIGVAWRPTAEEPPPPPPPAAPPPKPSGNAGATTGAFVARMKPDGAVEAVRRPLRKTSARMRRPTGPLGGPAPDMASPPSGPQPLKKSWF